MGRVVVEPPYKAFVAVWGGKATQERGAGPAPYGAGPSPGLPLSSTVESTPYVDSVGLCAKNTNRLSPQ